MTSEPKTNSSDLNALRGALIAAQTPLAGRKDYAITDPAFLDPILADALARNTGGRAPTTDKEREDVMWSAGVALSSALQAGDGLQRLEELVRRRYQSPEVSRDGATVTVDAGIVPGKLGVNRGKYFLGESPYVEGSEWKTQEIARLITEALANHPDAQTVKVQAIIPTRDGFPVWTYVYDRTDDRIRVFVPNRRDQIYFTEPLGGDLGPYQRGEKSLSYWKLGHEWKKW